MASTLRKTRKPYGIHVYKPEARRRIKPARNISWWLIISASAGVSRSVEIGNLDTRMMLALIRLQMRDYRARMPVKEEAKVAVYAKQ